MRATQQIFRARREYNQWVNNQTLEDYALRFTAKKARRWSSWQVSMTALGATAFLALEAIGGAITLNYGFTNAVIAMLMVGVTIFAIGLPISYHAAKQGLDIDLLTRGAGFGYLGSTITSLIYASFTFIFFAIEAAILAMGLKALFGIPLYLGYILCAAAVIPIVTHGITAISKFQIGTQGIWLVLQLMALAAIAIFELSRVADWTAYRGSVAHGAEAFDLALFGAASAVIFALIAQIGEQVDYLRFLPPRERVSKLSWWAALLAAGPGWIVIGVVKMLTGSFLAWLAFSDGLPFTLATDPTHMYQMAFNYITQSSYAALWLAALMVIISQMKINVTNAYAGSIAWSNFFSRLTHSHPGRVVWLVFNVAIALLLMELGIFQILEDILGVFAIVAVSWLGTLAADLSISLKLKLRPQQIEFKRAHLYDLNPVGPGSMLTATVLGLSCYLGAFGDAAQALAHFIALATTFVMAPFIAWFTGGRYYIARDSSQLLPTATVHKCCICENDFEHEDMSHCPAYQGAICSLCCSLDSRCMDSCKPDARFASQILYWLGKILPVTVTAALDSRLGHYLAMLSAIAGVNAALLTLVYYHINPADSGNADQIASMLWTLFFVFMIIAGVLAWLFLLSQESRLVAQAESTRQNQRLMKEVDAHRATDLELQRAKDHAEAANLAKSRYLSGISHELRTPLQSILGYAQLLERDPGIPPERRESIAIMRRSGEYLTDLIEGLLDISSIEAGRLEIRREQVDLHTLLEEVVNMFSLQAAHKSIAFNYRCSAQLPRYINSDEKRLRQILINLLSNAVKFTEQGDVNFSVLYRSHVAEFIVEDTGSGIASEDLERIFNPFERIPNPGKTNIPGTGLGLTIVRLLSEIMGGDIRVASTPGTGSRFTLQIMLSRIDSPSFVVTTAQRIIGFAGDTRRVMVVDDEPQHRSLINQLLTPLGFMVVEARDAEHCLHMLPTKTPDLLLVDINMPGMSGLELSRSVRELGIRVPIMLISGNAREPMSNQEDVAYHNDFMAKPIKLNTLLARIGKLLDVSWRYESTPREAGPGVSVGTPPPTLNNIPTTHPAVVQLRTYAELGFLRGVKEQLRELESSETLSRTVLQHLNQLAGNAQLNKILEILE
jgi:signal transduction histidine kinase/CheY-like chemotaxis protein